MSVIKHSDRAAHWRHNYSYIVVSGHFTVTYVINHSVDWVIWSYIMGSGHITVTFVINHSGNTAIWRYIKTSIVCKVCKSFIKQSKLKRHLPIPIRIQPSSWVVCCKVLHFKHDLKSHFPVHGDVCVQWIIGHSWWPTVLPAWHAYSAGLRQTVHWLCAREGQAQ
jgi:hypothetical protein